MLMGAGRIGAAMQPRYVVEREVGRGGMATVFLAHDREHDRQVAIKVLHPDLAVALGPERFRREVDIAGRLHHPNILGIYESGEADGQLYFVMPFVAGESLRARLDREGELPVTEAVRIAAAVAEALEYAHGQGVLHRDVKPENILLDGDAVLVADFGIARAISDDQAERLTQTGITLGTPVYMSPEQSFAERDLDGRSDLYSLGCVLYEMLTGTPPFTGTNAQAITARHHMEPVPSITVVRPAVSDAVEDLVMCALAKSRADRCATGAFASQLRALLDAGQTTERRTGPTRRVPTPTISAVVAARRRTRLTAAAVGILLLIAAGATAAWYFTRPPPFADVANSRLAVLYFRDVSPQGTLGYLADGLTESLIDGMSAAGIDVVSRGGVLPFRNTDAQPDSVALALAAAGDSIGFVVYGTVAEVNGAARVTVTLADASNTRPSQKAFTLPLDSAATEAAAASRFADIEEFLRRRIGQTVAMRKPSDAAASARAWTLLQRAEYERKRADASWQSGDTSAAARALDVADSLARLAGSQAPKWAAPLVLRGRLASRRASSTRASAEAAPLLDSAAALAARAVAIAPRDPDALELQGSVTFAFVQRGLTPDTSSASARVDSAARELRAAVAINEQQASAWVRLSEVAYRQLNRSEARDFAKKAYDADIYLENAPAVLWRLFVTAYDIGEPAEAQKWCAEANRRFPEDPRFLQCQLILMTMRGAQPDIPRGWQLVEDLDTRWPKPQRPFLARWDRMLMAAAIGRAGLPDSARQVILRARADRTIDPRAELQGLEAFARTVIGDHDEALTLLEHYLAEFPEHREGFRRLNTWWWQDIQNEPRFVKLTRGE